MGRGLRQTGETEAQSLQAGGAVALAPGKVKNEARSGCSLPPLKGAHRNQEEPPTAGHAVDTPRALARA